MNRFFFEQEDRQGDMVRLHSNDAVHMLRVLRLNAGAQLILLDGSGLEYPARIESIGKGEAFARIYASRPNTTEPKCRVTLYQGLPKANKLESVIQKCVELGIYEIAPVLTGRCVTRPYEFTKKHERYSRIAYEAAKQSRRGIIPLVAPLRELRDCSFEGHELIILPYEEERGTSLKQAIRAKAVKNAALIIGPEGGFLEEEVEYLKSKGALPVSLGQRILRTETAGMAALAMLLYEWEL